MPLREIERLRITPERDRNVFHPSPKLSLRRMSILPLNAVEVYFAQGLLQAVALRNEAAPICAYATCAVHVRLRRQSSSTWAYLRRQLIAQWVVDLAFLPQRPVRIEVVGECVVVLTYGNLNVDYRCNDNCNDRQ